MPWAITATHETLSYSQSPTRKRTYTVYRCSWHLPEKLCKKDELHVEYPKIKSRKHSDDIRTCKKEFSF